MLEADEVKAGDPLMDGPINPHDILHVKGVDALQKYLVNEVQEVYRLQGVSINDKHIEVIVRQMLRRVRIESVGSTNFLVGEHVDKALFEDENRRVRAQAGDRRRRRSRCSWGSPRPPSAPTASSRPPRSRRPPRSSPRPASTGPETSCGA